MTKAPTATICIPVYNGARYLASAIDSALGQSFADLELILSDNGSVDSTQEICVAAAARDPRVRYFRSDVNRGLAWNFNNAFHLSRGQFMVWLGYDDLFAPDFIGRCVAALEGDPGAVVCFTNANYIGPQGELLEKRDLKDIASSRRVDERMMDVFYDFWCEPVCGLMRMEVLRQTHLYGRYADSDRVLLMEMALRGRFARVPEYLFSRRSHPFQTTTANEDRWGRTLIFDPTAAGKAVCPWWRQFFGLASAIRRAPLPLGQKLTALKRFYWWCSNHRGILYRDFERGVQHLAGRLLP